MNINEIIDRMAEIKTQTESLDDEYESLQAQLLVEAEKALTDTKNKSVNWTSDNNNSASVTVSDTVSVVAGELLEDIFGKVYPGMAEKKITYTLKAPAKRILSAIWHGEYCEGSVSQIIEGLDCDDRTKQVLMKKIKGINFEKDKQNLMKIAGLSEEDSSDTAYLINEVAAWENICTIIKVNHNGEISPEILRDMITKINAAVNVSRGMKATVTVFEDSETG